MDKACKIFVNDNCVTRIKKENNLARTPQLLAYYCDSLLKKTNAASSDDTDLEKQIADVMIIFRFIQDCEVFLKFFSQKFACRLVGGTSISDEAETSMISKFKEEKGFEFTSKLQKMFSDIGVSKEINIRFRKFMENLHSSSDKFLDFNALVLTSGSWPLKEAPTLTLPHELEVCRKNFTEFYSSSNQGKKLQWLTQQGVSKGELMTGCFSKRYNLTSSSLQISILMLFNKRELYTVEELLANTNISANLLNGNLDLLVKFKILVRSDAGYGEKILSYLSLMYWSAMFLPRSFFLKKMLYILTLLNSISLFALCNTSTGTSYSLNKGFKYKTRKFKIDVSRLINFFFFTKDITKTFNCFFYRLLLRSNLRMTKRLRWQMLTQTKKF